MKALSFVLLFIFGMGFAAPAWAFPEMIRHGYTSCMTCHVSPNGGGLMTPYGRSMSKEILSRHAYEGEERLFHGALDAEGLNSWLDGSREIGFNVGGDVRWVQSHKESNDARERRSIFMQAEIEAAAQYKTLTLTGAFGRFPKGRDEFVSRSRKWSAIYRPLDGVSIRAGRFLPSHGLLVPEHIYLTRKELGFDQGFERNALEVAWVTEKFTIFVTKTKDPDGQLFQEDGLSLRVEQTLAETKKWGLSVYRGDGPAQDRLLVGADAQLAFGHSFVTLAEINYVENENTAVKTRGFVGMSKTSYEFTRGVFAQLFLERSHRDVGNPLGYRDGFGPGFQFFPRPHWELSGHWIRRVDAQNSQRSGDEAYLLLHYYL
ncbi:MAG: hypothetical protein KF767_06540 [Bdellovibrionaceae bacterium]|nr:hypothetical protein [Pseudobdellovibrionaceae bacterium]